MKTLRIMRAKLVYAGMLSVLTAVCACEKNEVIVLGTDIRVVNTAVGLDVKVDPGKNVFYAKETPILYGANRIYMLERTSVPLKVVNAADTTAKLYDNTIKFNSGIYSLYIVGQAPTVETVIKEELDFPFINRPDKIITKADSVVNVRFINLSPNSFPLKIKIATATGNEIDNLPYKGFGNWKAYTATAASTVYAFQLRDATTDALITTFNLTANATNRFKNVSLIVKGLQGTTIGTNAFGVMAINHF